MTKRCTLNGNSLLPSKCGQLNQKNLVSDNYDEMLEKFLFSTEFKSNLSEGVVEYRVALDGFL